MEWKYGYIVIFTPPYLGVVVLTVGFKIFSEGPPGLG